MGSINNLFTWILLKKCEKTILIKPSYMNINVIFKKHFLSKFRSYTGKNPFIWILTKQLLNHLS